MALPQPPAEIRIATALAADRGDHPDIARFADVLVDGFDWQGFIRILRFHRLEIHVASQMQMLPADCVPQDVARELAMLALQARAHSRAMVSELVRLVQLFRSANLDLLCFKGPATAQRLRGDPGCRTARDLDLLIRGEDASAAVDLLMSNGYSLAAEHVEMPLTAERLGSIQGWMSNIAFRNADHGIVELHWRLFRRRSEFPLEMDRLWNGSQTIQIGDTPVRVMNGAIEAIYLALHGSKHGWKRLHWLLDIHWMMCNAETDWEEILQISRDLGVARSVSEALVLSNRVYGSGLPDALLSDPRLLRQGERLAGFVLAHRYRTPPRDDTARDQLRWELHAFRRRQGLGSKLDVLAMHLMPRPDDWTVASLPTWVRKTHFLVRAVQISRFAISALAETPRSPE